MKRREFLAKAAAAAAGLGFAGQGLAPAEQEKVTVVQVFHPGAMVNAEPNDEVAAEMVRRGILRLTGKESVAEAWAQFVAPDDVVGIKVNPLSGWGLSTNLGVVAEIVRGLVAAGVPEKNIIIWDRFASHLERAGFEIKEDGAGVRCYGTDSPSGGEDEEVVYEPRREDYPLGLPDWSPSQFSKIATRQVTKIINAPVLKDHLQSGITGALKNIAFGVINKTSRFHRAPYNCDPAIAQVAAHPAIREKVVLHICDALRACYEGGPVYQDQFSWEAKTLLFATDPVAMDRVLLDIVQAKRKEHRLPDLYRTPRPPKHIHTAAKLGLGTDDLQKVEVVRVNLG